MESVKMLVNEILSTSTDISRQTFMLKPHTMEAGTIVSPYSRKGLPSHKHFFRLAGVTPHECPIHPQKGPLDESIYLFRCEMCGAAAEVRRGFLWP